MGQKLEQANHQQFKCQGLPRGEEGGGGGVEVLNCYRITAR